MPCTPGGSGHRTEPGRIVKSRIATMPEGLAEVVADTDEDSWARWLSDGAWSQWWHVAHRTEDVSVTGPYEGAGGPAALLSVTAWQPDEWSVRTKPASLYVPPRTRSFHLISATGITAADLCQRRKGAPPC